MSEAYHVEDKLARAPFGIMLAAFLFDQERRDDLHHGLHVNVESIAHHPEFDHPSLDSPYCA
jgi:hypothetical protein